VAESEAQDAITFVVDLLMYNKMRSNTTNSKSTANPH